MKLLLEIKVAGGQTQSHLSSVSLLTAAPLHCHRLDSVHWSHQTIVVVVCPHVYTVTMQYELNIYTLNLGSQKILLQSSVRRSRQIYSGEATGEANADFD